MSGLQIQCKGAKVLADAILYNSNLQELILKSNALTNKGCKALLRVLVGKTDFQLLDISDNSATVEGLEKYLSF